MCNPLADICDSAVRELEAILGRDRCGAIVCGRSMLRFKDPIDGESPLIMTFRVMVVPVMARLGYVQRAFDFTGFEECVVAVVPMNHPLNDAEAQARSALKRSNVRRGVATDGFLWVLMDRGPSGPKRRTVADIRSYYMDALIRRRFMQAVESDDRYAEEFVSAFGKIDGTGDREGTRPPP